MKLVAIQVECYAGAKADETPRRFTVEGHEVQIGEVLDRPSFFQKLATALALWAMGQALAANGYITPATSGALPTQPDSAIQAIRFFTGPVPAVLLIVAVLFAWNYPITRESHSETLRILAERE